MLLSDRSGLFLALLAAQVVVALAHLRGGRGGGWTFGWPQTSDQYEWGGTHYLYSDSDVAYIGLPSGSVLSQTSTTVRYPPNVYSARYLKVEVVFFDLGGAPDWTPSAIDYCSQSTDTVSFDVGESYNITWCGSLHAKEHIFPEDQIIINYNQLSAITNLGGGFGFRIYAVPTDTEITSVQAHEAPQLIYSPIFPKPFESLRDYRVVMHAPHETTLHVKAIHMDLDNECTADVSFETLGGIVAGPYCGSSLFTAKFDESEEIVLLFQTGHNEVRSGYILSYWTEPHTAVGDLDADESSNKGSIWKVLILVGGTVIVIVFIILVIFIMMLRQKRRNRAHATRSLQQHGAGRCSGYDNPNIYTLEPAKDAVFVPPPPYPELYTVDNLAGDQIDADKEAPPPYEA